ncbi:MAG: AraC family transcriptional regulator [Clostridiales bacterium]|jgi:AraC-like DNA-binding protein|nr:AraC family transcriptional regulator [Clostridiales bacterium]
MRTNFYKRKIENLIIIDKIVTLHYLEYPKNFVFDGEAHDFWEIVYIDKGGVVCSINHGAGFALKQGQILFHKPNEFHTIRADGVTAADVFVFSFVSKSEAMQFFNGKLLTLDKREKDIIGIIIGEALSTFKVPVFDPQLKKFELSDTPALGGQQMLRINLEMLLILLMRSDISGKKPSAVFVPENELSGHIEAAVIAFLKDGIYKKLRLDDICGEFNYGKTFLCTRFKKSTKMTIFQYYARLKIDEAKKLIREKNMTLSEISDALRFDSYSHFNKTFRAQTGHSPGEYGKLLKI